MLPRLGIKNSNDAKHIAKQNVYTSIPLKRDNIDDFLNIFHIAD